MIEHAAERRIAEKPARAHDDRIDVRVLVAALRFVGRKIPEDLRGAPDERRSLGCVQVRRDGDEVIAAVAVRGEYEPLAAFLEVPEPRARGENFHLAPGIVHVVLARHAIAHGLEQIRHARSISGVTAVPDVQWPGGVRRDELHEHGFAPACAGAPVGVAFVENADDLGTVGCVVEKEIDESGARDLDPGDRGVRRQGRL